MNMSCVSYQIKKASTANDHGKNCIKDRPPLVRHLYRNRLLPYHTALKLDVQALRSYLSLICEYELYILPNKKVSTAKGHGKIYMKDRPPLVRHLLCNCLYKPIFRVFRKRFGTYAPLQGNL